MSFVFLGVVYLLENSAYKGVYVYVCVSKWYNLALFGLAFWWTCQSKIQSSDKKTLPFTYHVALIVLGNNKQGIQSVVL